MVEAPVSMKYLDASVLAISHDITSVWKHGYARWLIEFSITFSFRSEREFEDAIRIEDLHTVVGRVCYNQVACVGNYDSSRIAEVSFAVPTNTDLKQQLVLPVGIQKT